VSDIESPGSIALAKLNNVHVILDDQSSPLDETFDNVWAIYCNSLPSWDNMLASPGEKKVDDELNEGEFEQGKRWADAGEFHQSMLSYLSQSDSSEMSQRRKLESRLSFGTLSSSRHRLIQLIDQCQMIGLRFLTSARLPKASTPT
jgi:hypothetical protein